MKYKLKNLTTSVILLILLDTSACFSQNYFVTTTKDSVSCRRINFFDTNAQGQMVDFEYVNYENDTIRLKKKIFLKFKSYVKMVFCT